MAGDDATVTFEFYATVRDAVGEKTLRRSVEPGTTVNEALREVAKDHPDLYSLLFTSEERLRPHINVSRNEEPIRDLDGPDTELEAGDRVTVTPSVSGGAGRASRVAGPVCSRATGTVASGGAEMVEPRACGVAGAVRPREGSR